VWHQFAKRIARLLPSCVVEVKKTTLTEVGDIEGADCPKEVFLIRTKLELEPLLPISAPKKINRN